MKKPLYDKMKAMFHLIEHAYQEIGALEQLIYRLAIGNTFNMRIVGFEGVKRLRREHPDCAITFKPNHLSEADFIILGVIFRLNQMKVLIEGGSNLFIEEIEIFRDVLPRVVLPELRYLSESHHLTIARYLSQRGAFKVFRKPLALKEPDGAELKLGRKDILSLSRAYRQHLVSEHEMYLTFPGYSTVKSGLLDRLKMESVKTGRSYTGKIDGFHHLPFQMDIEAALDAGVDVYIVPVNIAYERVLEDENFQELTRMHDAGVSEEEIYLHDISFIIRRFCEEKRKVDLSIKFGEPRRIDTKALRGDVLGTKIKSAANSHAREAFEQVMGMQPVFPANIYFSAFDESLNRMPARVMQEKIDDIRDHLRNLKWGRQGRRVDLYYILGYNNRIMAAEELINRTFEVFAALQNPITSLDGETFVVHNRDVAVQYRNHIAHFLMAS
jgi:glycerol-3-phosphate O-acyltransferase